MARNFIPKKEQNTKLIRRIYQLYILGWNLNRIAGMKIKMKKKANCIEGNTMLDNTISLKFIQLGKGFRGKIGID